MPDDKLTLMVTTVVASTIVTLTISRNICQRKHRFWMHPLFQHHPHWSACNMLMAKLRQVEGEEMYLGFTTLSHNNFDNLLW